MGPSIQGRSCGPAFSVSGKGYCKSKPWPHLAASPYFLSLEVLSWQGRGRGTVSTTAGARGESALPSREMSLRGSARAKCSAQHTGPCKKPAGKKGPWPHDVRVIEGAPALGFLRPLEQDPWSPHKFPCRSFWNVSFTHGEETLSTVHLYPRAAENTGKVSPSSQALRQISWVRFPYAAAFSCSGAQINLL